MACLDWPQACAGHTCAGLRCWRPSTGTNLFRHKRRDDAADARSAALDGIVRQCWRLRWPRRPLWPALGGHSVYARGRGFRRALASAVGRRERAPRASMRAQPSTGPAACRTVWSRCCWHWAAVIFLGALEVIIVTSDCRVIFFEGWHEKDFYQGFENRVGSFRSFSNIV